MNIEELLYPPTALTDEHLDWMAHTYQIDIVKYRAALQHCYVLGRASAWKEANAQIKEAFKPLKRKEVIL